MDILFSKNFFPKFVISYIIPGFRERGCAFMAIIKENLLYTETHEWVKVEGGVACVGISDHAQESLGDIVYIELPSVGDVLEIKRVFGLIESVKAASDLYVPLSGKVIEVNSEVIDNPARINEDVYGCWLYRSEISDEEEIKTLLSSEQYRVTFDD